MEAGTLWRQVEGNGSFIIHHGENVVLFIGITALKTHMVDSAR